MNKSSKQRRRNMRAEAKKNKGNVISANPQRNMQMVVNKNIDADGKTFTFTAHEPITSDRPVVFKNHGYVDSYKQPSKFHTESEY